MGDSELMTHKAAIKELLTEYYRCQSLCSYAGKPCLDECWFDAENEQFIIMASEASQFQSMYILEENVKDGIEYYVEEIRREANRADDLAMLYEYESRDMGVYECTSRIRELAKHLQQLLSKKA